MATKKKSGLTTYDPAKVKVTAKLAKAANNHLAKRFDADEDVPAVPGDDAKWAVYWAVRDVLVTLITQKKNALFQQYGWSGKVDADYGFTSQDFPVFLRAIADNLKASYKYTFLPDSSFSSTNLSKTLNELYLAICDETY